MQRFNIFNQIHKALRVLLYDTALQLQQTNFLQPEESELVLEKVRTALNTFDKHAVHEDEFVLPAIARFEPSLVNAFEEEHVHDHALANELRILVDELEKDIPAPQRVAAGTALMHAFIAFMTFNLEHMGREESVLNQRLWRYYTDAEIKALNQKIVDAISPEEMAVTSAWMMRGLSNTEIAGWLKEVQKNAPDFVFNALFSIAEKELDHQRFRKILEDLTEGAMVA